MDKYINANIIFSKFCNAYTELKKDLPIRPSEMGVLNIIVQREGKFTPLMIADLLDVSKPMITTHITVLEKKGYIKKEYSKEDKRSFYVIPTDKAKELVKVTEEKMRNYLSQIENFLGEENFNNLLEILSDTNKVLKKIKGGCFIMDINDLTWNPWHGCHKCSEGCQNCYAYFLDKRYGRDTNEVVLNKSNIDLPIKKDKEGNYKLPSGSFVRVCMTSDFFLEEADEWREQAWKYIRLRKDVTFSLLTKRAHRIKECLPSDWGDGWDNVQFAVSAENQKRVDERIPYLLEIPSKHNWISVKPFIGEVDLEKYLATGKIETVLAGGENYLGSRPLHYEWVKKLHDQCEKYNVHLIFGQTGNVFIKDGKEYKIRNRTDQMIQALKSGLHYPPVDIEAEIQKINERKERMKALKGGKKNTDINMI